LGVANYEVRILKPLVAKKKSPIPNEACDWYVAPPPSADCAEAKFLFLFKEKVDSGGSKNFQI